MTIRELDGNAAEPAQVWTILHSSLRSTNDCETR